MKKLSKVFLNTATLTVVALFSLSCDGSENPVNPEMELTESSLHFTSKAETSQTVEVKNVTNWEVVNNLDWITAQKQGNNLIVTAQPSRLLTNREGIITVVNTDKPESLAEIQILQDHGTPKVYTLDLDGVPLEHLSNNGRYAAGEWNQTGIVFDIEKISNVNYTAPVYPFADNPQLRSEDLFSLSGVSNNGIPFAKGVTADGTTTVKISVTGLDYIPILVKNGTDETQLPKPATWITSTGGDYLGVVPDLISGDGKYIVGRIMNYGNIWVACKWTLDGNTYKFSEIAPEEITTEFDGMYTDITKYPKPQTSTGLSLDGKYSCGVINKLPVGSYGNHEYTPYAYNMETGTLTKVSGEIDAIATFVTDNGTLFYASPNQYPAVGDKNPYVYENGQKSEFKAWVQTKYGIDIGTNAGYVSAVNKDESVVMWVTYEPTGFVNHVIVIEP
ncbi:MAG: hypothetical protein LBT56_03005 [Prevotellaceae bacterium]|jgi:hypothetical protein|nr:hypothetical protein [Prevotellaceae bacterium]